MTTLNAPPVDGRSTKALFWILPGEQAFTTLTANEMKKLLFISSYDAYDPDSPAPKGHGYQRIPMNSRFPQIARYFAENPDLLTPIIVSVRVSEPDGIQRFEELLSAGELETIRQEFGDSVCSIVDGQHRFGGLVYAVEHAADLGVEGSDDFNPVAPVMLYFGMDYVTEAEMFDTINATQRKLPKALIEVTKGDITDRDDKSHAQRIREITFAMARDTDSPWFDQINMTGARDPNRKVTYEGLRRSTSNMLTSELVSRLDSHAIDPEELAKSYWRLVSQACSQAWIGGTRVTKDELGIEKEEEIPYRIKELVGVAALARLGKDIITSGLEVLKYEPLQATMTDYVSKLSEIDWEKRQDNPWVASQAGFAGQKDLYNLLFGLVYNDVRPGESA